jgi:hypothetical protein
MDAAVMELREALAAADQAALGGSNDDEIDTLRYALDLAVEMIEECFGVMLDASPVTE